MLEINLNRPAASADGSLGSNSHAPVVSPLAMLLERDQMQQQQQQSPTGGGSKRARVAPSTSIPSRPEAPSAAQAQPARPFAPPPPPPPPPPSPRRLSPPAEGSDAVAEEEMPSGSGDAGIVAGNDRQRRQRSSTSTAVIPKMRAGSASASAAAAAAAKASAAVYHFYHAIVNGRERAVALAEVRIASARAAGASRMRLVELLGDLAAAHAGGGLSGSSPSPFDGLHDGAPPLPPAPQAAPSSSSSSSSAAASAASCALVLSRALDLIDPRDEWDWRASTPAALAALATGRAAALSSRSRSGSGGGSLSSSFAAASLSSSAEASSSPPSSSFSSLLDPRELRVRLSVGPSKGHVVSLAVMLSKPADWFIATMGEFGAATARALSRLREDPAAIGEWLGGREGQSGLRHAARLCSELRAFSPAWAASDVATAMETCMLSGFADEEGHHLSPSSSSVAAAAGGGGGVSDADGGDGDDRDNAIREELSDLEDTGSGDVDAEGISGGGEEGGEGGVGAAGEERRGITNARRRRRRQRPSSSASAASPPAPSASSSLPSRAELSVVLEAMCLSEEQRRTVVGLRRIYLRKRRAAAQSRAEALATLRGLLLLAPEKAAECGGGGGDKGSADGTNNNQCGSEKAGAPTAAETPRQQQARGRRGAANDIGRGAYVRALAVAAALSAAAAADAWAETEISIRVSSMCTRAQGAIYNGLVYPRPHCVPSFAELVAEQAGEPPAEAILSGAVET